MRARWWHVLAYLLGRRPAVIEGPENARYGTVVDVCPSSAGLVLEAWWGARGEPTARLRVEVECGYDVRFGDRVAWDGCGTLWWFPDGRKTGSRLKPIGQPRSAADES